MFGFIISCFAILILLYRMLTLFQLNFIEKSIQKNKFNNGFCKKCKNKFVKEDVDFLSSATIYKCNTCSNSVIIEFDSINNSFDDYDIRNNEEYKLCKQDIEKEIGFIQ